MTSVSTESLIRKLTEEELNDILNSLPKVFSALSVTANKVRSEIQESLREQLKEVEIVPSGIPELKAEINRQFQEAQIHFGETVGFGAAEALGGPITQMALNSFHTSGTQKNISIGVDRIKELINLLEKQKKPSCNVYFNKQLVYNPNITQIQEQQGKSKFEFERITFDDVILRKQSELVGITVKKLISNSNLYRGDELPKPEDKSWYDLFKSTINPDRIQSSDILRIELDVDLLYAYSITPQDICSALDAGDPPLFRCVFSPTSIGIIDFYPDEHIISKKEMGDITAEIIRDNAARVFIQTTLLPNLDKVIIRGIPNILSIIPVTVSLISLIKDEKLISSPRLWQIQLDRIQGYLTGIGTDNFDDLFRVCNITRNEPWVMINDIWYATILLPPYAVKMVKKKDDPTGKEEPVDEKPREYLARVIKTDEDDEKAYLKDDEEKKKKVRTERDEKRRQGIIDRNEKPLEYSQRPLTDVARYSKFVYVSTEGTALRKLLLLDQVDGVHTISSDVHEILRILGIEAARNFLIRDFIRVISLDGGSTSINPRHIGLLVDFMTNKGSLTQITFAGIAREELGSLALASLERSMEVAKAASIHGRSEPINTTSASIYAGTRAGFGTGLSQVYMSAEGRRQIEMYQNMIGRTKEENIGKIDPLEFKNVLRMDKQGIEDPEIQLELLSSNIMSLNTDISMEIEGELQFPEMVATFGQMDPEQARQVLDLYPSGSQLVSPLLLDAARKVEQVPCRIQPPVQPVTIQGSTRPPGIIESPSGPVVILPPVQVTISSETSVESLSTDDFDKGPGISTDDL